MYGSKHFYYKDGLEASLSVDETNSKEVSHTVKVVDDNHVEILATSKTKKIYKKAIIYVTNKNIATEQLKTYGDNMSNKYLYKLKNLNQKHLVKFDISNIANEAYLKVMGHNYSGKKVYFCKKMDKTSCFVDAYKLMNNTIYLVDKKTNGIVFSHKLDGLHGHEVKFYARKQKKTNLEFPSLTG